MPIGYPTKAVTLVVPFTAGQSGDILVCILADGLGKLWGKSVVVDNKPGAGGALGSQTVMRAAPDGYTLLLSSSGPIAIAPHLNKIIGYDPRYATRSTKTSKKVLATEPVTQRMIGIGMQQVGGSAEDFGGYISSEYTKWGNVVKTGTIKADCHEDHRYARTHRPARRQCCQCGR